MVASGPYRDGPEEERAVALKCFCADGTMGAARLPPPGYELAWHGTRARHVASILEHGLQPSGTKLPDGTFLKPPSNHYALGSSHQGISNWAGAIFVSPSVSYASHACYAERVLHNGDMYAVLVEVAVRAG